MVARGGTRTHDFHLMRVARWPLLYSAMVAAFGLITKTSLSMLPTRTHYTTLLKVKGNVKTGGQALVPKVRIELTTSAL